MATKKKRNYKVTKELRARHLSLQVHSALKKAGIPHSTNPVNRVSATQFHKAISAGKKANSKGWMVDTHSVEEYRSMRCFLTSDGKSGIAITKTGDVVSLFSSGGGGKMAKLIPYAVAAGGKKLDCFVSNEKTSLHNQYARYGAKATGKTPFDPKEAPSDYNPNDDVTHVVAMTLPSSLDELISSYNREARVPLDSVRTYKNYNRMINARDNALAKSVSQSALALVAG